MNIGKSQQFEKVYKGYIWRFAKRQGASIFFRGIRSWEKDGVEERNLQILNTWGPLFLGPLYWPLPTIYLEGKPEYNHISSTLIRDISQGIASKAGSGEKSEEEIEELVPAEVAREVAELYSADPKES
jgi:phosphopantetheine adenylyltransferase